MKFSFFSWKKLDFFFYLKSPYTLGKKVDERYMTSRKGVFAGGDLIGTKATVAWAARSGRNASEEIIKYLLGEE